jgi:polysaccharide biosynthesis transport protein
MPAFRRTATRDFITVLIRGWKLIVGFAVTFGLLALAVCWLQKPVYEAKVTLYVTAAGNSQGPSSPYENVMGSALAIGSYARLAYSDAVLGPAMEAAGLNIPMDEAKNKVRTEVTPDTVMFTLSAQDQNGEVAERFVSAVAQSMIDRVAALEVPNGGGPPTSRLTIVSPATLNPHPVSPTTSTDVTLAMFGGLLAGVAAALTRERLNNVVRDERDLEKVIGARPLERIPHDKKLGAALTVDFNGPGGAAAGAFRHLRTALSVAHSKGSLATFLVTSPREGEGKSTVALNLAAALAESGSTVVLVDADLRNPAVAKRMGNGEVPGLADFIHSQVPPLQLSAMAMRGLKVIGTGRTRDKDPAGLLASSACGKFFKQLAESFDYVIVDSPSLLDGPEAEAAACWADGVLLVVRRGKSKLSDCDASVTRLSDIDAELVGVVFNDIRLPRGHKRTAPPAAVRPRRHRSASETATRVDEINVGVERTVADAAAKAHDREHRSASETATRVDEINVGVERKPADGAAKPHDREH